MKGERNDGGKVGEQADAAGGAADHCLSKGDGDGEETLHEQEEEEAALVAGEDGLTEFAPGGKRGLAGGEHDVGDEIFGYPIDQANHDAKGQKQENANQNRSEGETAEGFGANIGECDQERSKADDQEEPEADGGQCSA